MLLNALRFLHSKGEEEEGEEGEHETTSFKDRSFLYAVKNVNFKVLIQRTLKFTQILIILGKK